MMAQTISICTSSQLSHSPIAQSVERRTVNPQVPGSSPGRGATKNLRYLNKLQLHPQRGGSMEYNFRGQVFDQKHPLNPHYCRTTRDELFINSSYPVVILRVNVAHRRGQVIVHSQRRILAPGRHACAWIVKLAAFHQDGYIRQATLKL